MMPNVVRGNRTVGLMMYLVSEGKANEHSEPHIVTGDQTVTAWYGTDELNREAALQIGRDLEQPARAFGVEIPGGNVWHCSLSLHQREGVLDDEKWAEIAQELIDEMGFSRNTVLATDDDGNPLTDEHGNPTGEEYVVRAGCRWAAVRHGLSGGGNDHIHIVVSLVREDGTKANVYRDWKKVQAVCGALEKKHGLEVLDSRQDERGSRGVKPAEVAVAEREGRAAPASTELARTVRACCTASEDEAEFVRRLRQEGLWVRPRFAQGRSDVVTGYTVAVEPPRGQKAVWYGGGRLGRDLTLPALRKGWSSTPENANEAVAEWAAAMGRARPAAPGREVVELSPDLWKRAEGDLYLMQQRLREVPLDDRSAWAHAARDAAGVFAAWSMKVEAAPGPLAEAADVLARSAQVRARDLRPRPTRMPSPHRSAPVMRMAATGGQGPAAEAIMWRQIMATTRALYEMHAARGDALSAANMARMIRDELRPIDATMVSLPDRAEGEAAASVALAGQAPIGRPAPARHVPSPSTQPAAPMPSTRSDLEPPSTQER